MSKNLILNLDAFIHGVMTKNTSMVDLIDGKSGLGKTTLSFQKGCYINNKVREYYKAKGIESEAPNFTLDNICWTPADLIEKLSNPKIKKGTHYILDEAMILSNRTTMSEMNRAIIVMMSMIRSKNVFITFNVNSIFDLDKNLVLHRADMLCHLYPRGGKFAARGDYQVIPSASGKLKNLFILGKRFYDYTKARPAFNDSFTSFFPFDEDEYERRKQEAISTYFQKNDRSSKMAQVSRDKYINYIKKNLPSHTAEEIGRIGGISARTVYRALKAEELNET